MKNNIYSTFDLSKSLLKFQEKVTKLLELTNVAEFDGITLKLREVEIRESALVLAGECIGLLLNNLSKSQDFLDRAMYQTEGWWHEKTQKHGCKKRQILTIGNVEVTLKVPYVVERSQQPNKNKQSRHEGFCPFLKYLGMSEGLTPFVLSTVVQYGAIAGSFEAARTTLIDWGINISLKRIQRLTYYFGQIGIDLRNRKVNDLKSGSLCALNTLENQRVIIAVDGGRTRIRVNKTVKRKVETNRIGFTGEWAEPKLLTIYTVNEQGKKIKTADITITNDGTYEGYQAFLEILEMYLFNLGISQAKQVLLIADGAEWIWKHIPPLLKKLQCPHETYQLLDFYHAAEHLQDFADAAFSTNNQRQQWFKTARKTLKKGRALDLIRNMDELILSATGERCKTLLRERNYIFKAYRRRLLKYHKVAEQKLPLGSGAIESLIRQVVNLRMKGNGKFWLKNHAEIMLHLRCQWVARSWDNFCDSIFNSFVKPKAA